MPIDDLQFIPEPYRGMIQTIEPDDIYLVHSITNGEPIRVRRIPAAMSASQAHDIENDFGGQRNTIVTRFKGRDLRSLFLELARAQGHLIGGAVFANPITGS
jgi:hypothetical protein